MTFINLLSKNKILQDIKNLFPNIDKKKVAKTIEIFDQFQDDMSPFTKYSKSDEQPYAMTKLGVNRYLIHLKKNNGIPGYKVCKGAFKKCYPVLEIIGNKVKKRAELYISARDDFEKKFPHYKKEFQSPYIMKAPKYDINHGKNKKSLIYPYYDCNLKDHIENFNPSKKERVGLLIDCVSGVIDIHRQQFVHRDLKEVNILIRIDEEGKVKKIKIADLDSVLKEEECTLENWLGTPFYTQYERQTNKTDVYALGRILSRILDLEKIVYCKESSDRILSPMEEQAILLIQLTKSTNPEERITSVAFLEKLKQLHEPIPINLP